MLEEASEPPPRLLSAGTMCSRTWVSILAMLLSSLALAASRWRSRAWHAAGPHLRKAHAQWLMLLLQSTRYGVDAAPQQPPPPLQPQPPSQPPGVFASKEQLATALDEYHTNSSSAERAYGRIESWDVSRFIHRIHTRLICL